jgi:hypothetical protein
MVKGATINELAAIFTHYAKETFNFNSNNFRDTSIIFFVSFFKT